MDVPVAGTRLSDITIELMRTAFASDAETPPGGVDPAVLVDLGRAAHVPFYVRTDSGNPMPQIGRPKVAKTLPKALPPAPGGRRPTVERHGDRHPAALGAADEFERDRAIILTALLPGCAPMSSSAPTSAMCAGRKTAPSSMCASSVEKTGRFPARLRWFRSWTTTSHSAGALPGRR